MKIVQIGVNCAKDDLTKIIKKIKVDLLILVEPLHYHNASIQNCYSHVNNKFIENIAITVNNEVETNFYVDRVFHLPALLVEADSQPGLFYKVMNAIWQEDLLVVNANLLVWRGRTRLILYLLGPNENLIPEYLGTKIAESLKQRLSY